MAWDDITPMLPNIEVPDHKPVETGLVDRTGKPFKRHPSPMGFHRPGKTRG